MSVIRTSANMIMKQLLHHPPLSFISFSGRPLLPCSRNPIIRLTPNRGISCSPIRCAAPDADADRKVSARLSQMQQLLQEAEERASSAGNGPTPQITLVNTKVDMRFNVKQAYWLSDRIRERIMQMEKNRINKDGEIVISSTKTRTQKGNIDDALAKLQAIIDAAAYVPPPPSEEQKKKIAKMAAIGEQKRLKSKKVLSDKKAFRRSRDSWD
ncbi:hypothetical protein ES319_D03G183300v1 [Gossypium barbadense]|uniref:Prokaryotic-type class I peptide chain release factors domain-containing protein n=1 Tax=Gossypium barbadense TaxID=3634 RepID=A0A5J5S647_GOSBA|nr:hypothetical protein ES319_D03G183300v1 [Gossypium barbadense]